MEFELLVWGLQLYLSQSTIHISYTSYKFKHFFQPPEDSRKTSMKDWEISFRQHVFQHYAQWQLQLYCCVAHIMFEFALIASKYLDINKGLRELLRSYRICPRIFALESEICIEDLALIRQPTRKYRVEIGCSCRELNFQAKFFKHEMTS